MLRTRVGYCGGAKEHPSYYSLGDHTEAISIDYDPEVTGYGDLLAIFWAQHNPLRNKGARQYINAVFTRDDAQREAAEASLTEHAGRLGVAASKIETEIIAIDRFTYAEGYHHKYYLGRYAGLRSFLEETYPGAKAFADSTAATRLNAYLGSGLDRDPARFLAELGDYGLPDRLESEVRGMFSR